MRVRSGLVLPVIALLALAGCFTAAAQEGRPASARSAPATGQVFPDPRPIGVVNGHGGLQDHPFGVRPELRGGVAERVAWVRSEMDRLVSAGFRRLMFNQLAGHPRTETSANKWEKSDQTYIAMAQWQALDPAFQRAFVAMLRDWTRARPDVELGVYLGFKGGRQSNLLPDGEARFLDVTRPADRQMLEECVAPWIEAGCRFVAFDYSSPGEARPYVAPSFEHLRRRFGIKVIGEAMPPDGDPLTTQYAWLGSSWYMDQTDPGASRRADPARQELIVAIERNTVTREQIESWWRRGFTFCCYAGPKFEAMVMDVVSKGR